MLGLREQIETAWKQGTNKNWNVVGLGNLLGAELSANTVAYGQLWEVTLHYNDCGKACAGNCWRGATKLVKDRIECMQRGMPDLHPDVEQKIWCIAFELHRRSCSHGKFETITPTWDNREGSDRCDCFEQAMVVYEEEQRDLNPVVYDPEDAWFEDRQV